MLERLNEKSFSVAVLRECAGWATNAEIAEALGASRRDVAHTLSHLARSGRVERESPPKTRGQRYRRTAVGEPVATAPAVPADRRRPDERNWEACLRYVRTHPGATTRAVSDATGVDRNKTMTALLGLARWKMVREVLTPVWGTRPVARWYAPDERSRVREEGRVLERCLKKKAPGPITSMPAAHLTVSVVGADGRPDGRPKGARYVGGKNILCPWGRPQFPTALSVGALPGPARNPFLFRKNRGDFSQRGNRKGPYLRNYLKPSGPSPRNVTT